MRWLHFLCYLKNHILKKCMCDLQVITTAPPHCELWVLNKNVVSHSYFKREIMYDLPPPPTHSALHIPSGPTHSPLVAILIPHFFFHLFLLVGG